jgi:8-amino-7-oxononanoate synthase
VSLDDDVRAELRRLEDEHRLRVPRVVDSTQSSAIVLDGTKVWNFASNDYLGLAEDPRLAKAASAAALEFGTGVGASRLIVGNHRQHVLLEQELADWLRAPAARLFNSGYAANVGVLTTLLRPGDVVFSDELNHASIIDGCRLSRAEVVVYPHLDTAALERELGRRGSAARRLVGSETLFSMDGDVADVAALARIARAADAALMLDEAHAVGVWGPEGRGVAAAADVVPDLLVGTCGKALGSFGAFVASSAPIAELLWNRARSFVFSTGLPPSVAAASRAAIEIVRGADGDQRRGMLAANVLLLRQLLPQLGGAACSAIAPLMIGDDRRVMELTAQLLEPRGPDGWRFYVQGIRPPTVPEGGARLRISLSAGHSLDQISELAFVRLRDVVAQRSST